MTKSSKEDEEVYKLLSKFKRINDTLDNAELCCTKTDGTKFIEEITPDEATEKQAELKEFINKLNNYGPTI